MAEAKTTDVKSKGVSSGLQIAGVTLQAFGTFMSNKEEARGFKLSASETVREGKLAAQRIREQGERVQSAQRVGFAKGGVELSGTALEVMAETANNAELNALEVERVAEKNARELKRAARRKRGAGIGGIVGAGIGAVVGGPAGAVIGSQVGGAVGGEIA